HELATNAVKYGAWSKRGGRVELSWTNSSRRAERWVMLVWRELGGPSVAPPNDLGFGSRLIERGIPNSRVSREFKPDGLVCNIELPAPEGQTM
ncbi:MAG: sensor histidine kinase, partial [Caulobacteraceae bacterium]